MIGWGSILLAEIREQQQQASQPLFAGIEELIDQVFLDAAVAGQQIGHEHFRKRRFVMKRREHGRLGDCGDQAVFQGGRGRDAYRMTVHAPFPEELADPQNSDNCLLALLGYDDDLDPAFLNIEYTVCRITLGENDLVLVEFEYGFTLADFGEKLLRIEFGLFGFLWHFLLYPRSQATALTSPKPVSATGYEL